MCVDVYYLKQNTRGFDHQLTLTIPQYVLGTVSELSYDHYNEVSTRQTLLFVYFEFQSLPNWIFLAMHTPFNVVRLLMYPFQKKNRERFRMGIQSNHCHGRLPNATVNTPRHQAILQIELQFQLQKALFDTNIHEHNNNTHVIMLCLETLIKVYTYRLHKSHQAGVMESESYWTLLPMTRGIKQHFAWNEHILSHNELWYINGLTKYSFF